MLYDPSGLEITSIQVSLAFRKKLPKSKKKPVDHFYTTLEQEFAFTVLQEHTSTMPWREKIESLITSESCSKKGQALKTGTETSNIDDLEQ